MSTIRSVFLFSCRAALAGASIFQAAAAITLNPATVPTLAYVKGQPLGGAGSVQSVNFVGSSIQFGVVAATVPAWLTVSPLSGLAIAAGTQVTFTANALCGSLGSGLYKATVTVKDLATSALLSVPVAVVISDPPPTLSIREGVTSLATKTLALGGSPVFTLTLVSSGAPISFSIASPVDQGYAQQGPGSTVVQTTSWMKISPQSGVAYSWGTPVTVSIDPSAWAQSAITGAFTATLDIKFGTPAQDLPVNFSVTVTPPSPVIANFTPPMLPQVPSGSMATFMINGTNFVPLLSTVALTTAGTSAAPLSDTGAKPDFAYQVLSPNAILVTIISDGTNIVAGALTAAGLTGLSIVVTNPDTSPLNSPAQFLPVTNAPIISSVTSASSYVQAAAGGHPTVAPYDVISVFGINLCRGCVALSGGAVLATLTPSTPVTSLRYPFSLTPDATNYVQVYFVKHSDNNAVLGQGYLLFATNTQINVLVPAGVVATQTASMLGTNALGFGLVDVIVGYGTVAPGAAPAATIAASGAAFSAPYNVVIATVNPGIFTVDSTGTGQGAILNADNSLNGTSGGNGAPAAKGSIVQIFMTGLGAPDSTATEATTLTGRTYPASCLAALTPATAGSTTVAPASYLAAVNTVNTAPNLYAPPAGYVAPTPLWANLDGAVIMGAFIPDSAHHFAPCLKVAPVVMIGTKAATVAYAGWTTDSVVGLYQINVTIPSSAASGDLPIVVTVGAVTSQLGVTVSVQ